MEHGVTHQGRWIILAARTRQEIILLFWQTPSKATTESLNVIVTVGDNQLKKGFPRTYCRGVNATISDSQCDQYVCCFLRMLTLLPARRGVPQMLRVVSRGRTRLFDRCVFHTPCRDRMVIVRAATLQPIR